MVVASGFSLWTGGRRTSSARCMCKQTYDRLGKLRDISIVHAQSLGVGAGVEDQLRLADQALFDEDAMTVDCAERRHRTDFIVRVENRNFIFSRQPDHGRVGEQP